MSFSPSLALQDPMLLEAANRSWMVHQMRLSEYFIYNHRLCRCCCCVVGVVVVVVAAVVVVVRNFLGSG